MRSIMTTTTASVPQHKTPQVFTDEELSEIFQINFAEIFGSPAEKPKSDYKGINLPKKDNNLGQHYHRVPLINMEFFCLI